jgi:hypothetical protein
MKSSSKYSVLIRHLLNDDCCAIFKLRYLPKLCHTLGQNLVTAQGSSSSVQQGLQEQNRLACVSTIRLVIPAIAGRATRPCITCDVPLAPESTERCLSLPELVPPPPAAVLCSSRWSVRRCALNELVSPSQHATIGRRRHLLLNRTGMPGIPMKCYTDEVCLYQ